MTRKHCTVLIYRAKQNIFLLQTGWPCPSCLLGALLGLSAPRLVAGHCLEQSCLAWSKPGQNQARACCKLNGVEDHVPGLNSMTWSTLVYQWNFTGKMVARDSTGANQNFLCIVIQLYDFFINIFVRSTGKPVLNHMKLFSFSVFSMLNNNFTHTHT